MSMDVFNGQIRQRIKIVAHWTSFTQFIKKSKRHSWIFILNQILKQISGRQCINASLEKSPYTMA